MDNIGEVSNCDISTGLESFFNNSIKRDIKSKLELKKIPHMRLSFETQFKIESFNTI